MKKQNIKINTPQGPPLVQVLPLTNKTESISPSSVNKTKYPDGLLAWGNMDSAITHGHLFNVLIVTAEEFPFTEFPSLASKHTTVYHVPISEVSKGGVVQETNHLHQPVMQILPGHDIGTILKRVVVLQRGTRETKSDELIYMSLLQKKRVLVVCMAGRNRSTATIVRFLLIFSARNPSSKESPMLLKSRKPNWKRENWEEYLRKKRNFEIFPLNSIQLAHLDETLRSLKPIKGQG